MPSEMLLAEFVTPIPFFSILWQPRHVDIEKQVMKLKPETQGPAIEASFDSEVYPMTIPDQCRMKA